MVRAKIQASQLVNRLQNHALNDSEMEPSQVSAAQDLLDRAGVSKVKQVDLVGDLQGDFTLKWDK